MVVDAGAVVDQGGDLLRGELLLVGAAAAHGVVGVGQVGHQAAGMERPGVTGARVAAVVVAHVVLEGDEQRQVRDARRLAQDVHAVLRVPLHQGELLGGQLPRLAQDLGG